MNAATRVLIVDDTVTYRKILSDVVGDLPHACVVGTAPNGRIALAKLERLKPNLVLLDVEMPEMDGFATLTEIRRRHRDISVVMVSGVNPSSVQTTIRALAHGAADFVAKPQGRQIAENRRYLLDALRPLVAVAGTRRWLGQVRNRGLPAETRSPVSRALTSSSASTPARSISKPRRPPPKIGLVAIGTSTGGPRALMEMLPKFSPRFPVPVIIVQHMPPSFTAALASQLDSRCPLEVREGVDGAQLEPGMVRLAPGGQHMVIRRRSGRLSLGLTSGPRVKGCRPSVDVTMRSLVGVASQPVLTVVMTGMGDDGTDGVRALTRAGSYNLIQDEASCVVYGMPRAVAEAGLADEVLSLAELAPRLNALVKPPSHAAVASRSGGNNHAGHAF